MPFIPWYMPVFFMPTLNESFCVSHIEIDVDCDVVVSTTDENFRSLREKIWVTPNCTPSERKKKKKCTTTFHSVYAGCSVYFAFRCGRVVETLDCVGRLMRVLYVSSAKTILNDGVLHLSHYPIQQLYSLCSAGVCQVYNPALWRAPTPFRKRPHGVIPYVPSITSPGFVYIRHRQCFTAIVCIRRRQC